MLSKLLLLHTHVMKLITAYYDDSVKNCEICMWSKEIISNVHVYRVRIASNSYVSGSNQPSSCSHTQSILDPSGVLGSGFTTSQRYPTKQEEPTTKTTLI